MHKNRASDQAGQRRPGRSDAQIGTVFDSLTQLSGEAHSRRAEAKRDGAVNGVVDAVASFGFVESVFEPFSASAVDAFAPSAVGAPGSSDVAAPVDAACPAWPVVFLGRVAAVARAFVVAVCIFDPIWGCRCCMARAAAPSEYRWGEPRCGSLPGAGFHWHAAPHDLRARP